MFLVFNHAKLPEINYENPVYSCAFCNNKFALIRIFLCTSFEKEVLEPFEFLERFAHVSE